MLSDATVIDVRITDNNCCRVKLNAIMSNGKTEYDVIFKKKNAASLKPSTDKSYDVVVCYHSLYPHLTEGSSFKEHTPIQ